MAREITFFTDDEEALEIAQHYFVDVIHEEALQTINGDLEEQAKYLLMHAHHHATPALIEVYEEKNEYVLSVVGLVTKEHEYLTHGVGKTLHEARVKAFSITAEYLAKTPLSYHSQFHGRVADEFETNA